MAWQLVVKHAQHLALVFNAQPGQGHARVISSLLAAPELRSCNVLTCEECQPMTAGRCGHVNCIRLLYQLHTPLCICMQGAVAVEGEGHLWRPSRRGSTAAAPAAPASPPVESAQSTASSALEVSPRYSLDNRPAGALLRHICKTSCILLSRNVA